MDRREPPSLGSPRSGPAADAGDAPPRLRPLRDTGTRRRRAPIWSRLGAVAIYLGIAVACVVVAGFTFLMVAAPTDLVRDQIVAQVKARTGRALELNGPTSFTLFPSVGLRLADVTLSSPPGMQSTPLITIKRLAVDVRLMPLLQREVVIERLVLGEPVFELIVDAQGRRSWDFADAGPVQPIRLAQVGSRGSRNDALPAELKDFVRNSSDPAKAGQVGSGVGGLEELTLVDTRIENGMLRYTDQRSGARQEVHKINAVVGLKSLSSPLEAKGDLVWQGERLRIDARLTTLKSLLDGRLAKLTASLAGPPLEASYDGTLTNRGAVELDGKLSASAGSLRTLAAWLGRELPPASGFGPASLTGIVRSAGSSVSLDAAVISIDGATSNGSLSVDTAGVRPLIKANLRVSELDLNTYRQTDAAGAPARAGAALLLPPRAPAPANGRGHVQSIEDLLQREAVTQPQVRGFSQRTGWNSEPIDLAGLGIIDTDAKLSIGKLSVGEMRIGASQIHVGLKASVLQMAIEDAQLYDGRARGFITLDATKAPTLGFNLQLENVSALPLLKDWAGLDAIAGKGKLTLAVAGHGTSEKEIVETLTGKAEITVADGAIIGWNMPQMIRGLSQGKFSGFQRLPSEKTDFGELFASFQIAGGIASNKDMRLTSPILRATGSGNIELPGRRLDYMVRPRLVASGVGQGTPGQGTPQDTAGFEIPVRVHGPWDRLSYAPDVQSVLRDPDKVIDTVDQIGKQLGVKGSLGDTLRRALGGGSAR